MRRELSSFFIDTISPPFERPVQGALPRFNGVLPLGTFSCVSPNVAYNETVVAKKSKSAHWFCPTLQLVFHGNKLVH